MTRDCRRAKPQSAATRALKSLIGPGGIRGNFSETKRAREIKSVFERLLRIQNLPHMFRSFENQGRESALPERRCEFRVFVDKVCKRLCRPCNRVAQG